MGNCCRKTERLQSNSNTIFDLEVNQLSQYTYNLAVNVDQFLDEFYQNDYNLDLTEVQENKKEIISKGFFFDMDLCFMEINQESIPSQPPDEIKFRLTENSQQEQTQKHHQVKMIKELLEYKQFKGILKEKGQLYSSNKQKRVRFIKK